MKMEVETGKQQLINLLRRAAESFNWSREQDGRFNWQSHFLSWLRNETEADAGILGHSL